MRTRRARRGDNALEFALILPVALLLIFGVVEGGWYMNRYLVVSGATRDAARVAAMVPEGGDVEEAARSELMAKLGPLSPTDEVQLTVTVVGTNPDRTVTVAVEVPYHPLSGWFVPAPGAIASTFELHMEEERPELEE